MQEDAPKPPLTPLGYRAARAFEAIPDHALKLKMLQVLHHLAKLGTVNPRQLAED